MTYKMDHNYNFPKYELVPPTIWIGIYITFYLVILFYNFREMVLFSA